MAGPKRRMGENRSCGREALRVGAGMALVLSASAGAIELTLSKGPQADYLERFAQRMEAAASHADFVGLSVVVVDQGEIVYLRSFGETKVNSGEDVRPDTVFRLASVSKGFSATLIGQLVEEGRLSWDQKVADLTPRFKLKTPQATDMVTLERLLSHQTGLPHHAYDNVIEAGRSLDEALEKTAAAPLLCAPGSCYSYQNVTFSVVGDIVAEVEGRSFEEALSERIFAPLDMRTASVGLKALKASESWAKPHKRSKRTSPWTSFLPNENYYRVAPAGGLNASAVDLAQWLRAQLGHEPFVLSPKELDDIHAPRIGTPQEKRKLRWMSARLSDADYALGWRVYNYAGARVVAHSGGVAGYRAIVAMLPEHDVGVAALWNSGSSRGWRIMPELLDAYLELDGQDWLGVDQLVAMLDEGEGEEDDAAEIGSP